MSVEFAGRPQKVRDDELCGTARVRGGGGGDWSYTRGKTASEFSSRQQRPHIGGAWALDNTLTFTLHCRRVGGWDRGGRLRADVGVFWGTPASHRLGGRMKEDTTYAFNLPSLDHRAVSCHTYSAHLCC